MSAHPLARLLARLTARIGVLVLLMGLAACSSVDGDQARICRSLVPGIELDGSISIDRIETDQVAQHGIRIVYRVSRPDGSVTAGFLRCGFGGGRLDDRRLKLEQLETATGDVSPVKLYFLQRFWLGDADATREGSRRLTGDTGLQPLIDVPVSSNIGYAIQSLLNILPVGAAYAFLAVAYALIYGLVDRINLAFGEIATIGSYAAVAVITAATGAGVGNGIVALTVAISLLFAALHGGLLGSVIGTTVFRPLARSNHRSFLIATIGLSIVLMEATRLTAGTRDRWIQPVLNETIVVLSGGFQVTTTPMQLLQIIGSLGLLILLIRSMKTSAFGRSWRAISDDPLMARMLGVNGARVATASFAISAGLAALAGAQSALHYGQASYGSGLMIGLKALAAALLGGLGSLTGAALGGLAIGATEILWAAYLPTDWRDTAILIGLILILVLRPTGLFGRSTDTSGDRRWIDTP